jgi:ribosome-associated protein
MENLDSNIIALKELVVKTLDENKADAIVEIDLRGKSSFSDYMVIASGGSSRQVAALANRILEEAAKNFPDGKRRVEGMAEADWVLVDLGDVVVHLFRPEVRSFYSLEKMWSVTVPATEHRRMVNKSAD